MLHRHLIDLSPVLRDAIAAELAIMPAERWIRAAQHLSERYRSQRDDYDTPLARDAVQALGYAALLMPATYAQIRGALSATAARIPGWQPRTILDLGSGPGTAIWAACDQWPTLESAEAWERESAFIGLGRRLAARATAPALAATRWVQRDLYASEWPHSQPFDLVILAHVLNEIEPSAQREIIQHAWKRTAGVLLIIEPGTSAAFPIVRTSRDTLRTLGAHTIAPCAHNVACPLHNDWCHFPQRIRRPEFQRRARGAPSEWEESKFSYAAMARFAPETPLRGRIIREPLVTKGYIDLRVSDANGTIVTERIQKRNKAAFRAARDFMWGDALDAPVDTGEQP